MSTSPLKKFNDGNEIPQLGYGVWQVEDDVAEKVVQQALDTGFRHVDTAQIYGNEAGVGKALANSSVNENDVFVTTKVWNDKHDFEAAQESFEVSMEKLGLSKPLDLLLIHWAKPAQGKYLEAWKALIDVQKQGRVRSIGVSNFPEEQLREIITETDVTPAIHQIELHPYFNQQALRDVHAELGIVTEAWSPLGQGGEILTDPVITEIAEAHGVTAAQVVIAWHLAIGNVVIPKSVTPERIVENFAALEVSLTDGEVQKISALSKDDGRIGPDPKDCDF